MLGKDRGLPSRDDCPSERSVIDFDSSDKHSSVDDWGQEGMHVVGIGLDLQKKIKPLVELYIYQKET